MSKDESDYGKGFTYCIGLFLSHEWQKKPQRDNGSPGAVAGWFFGASDHLQGLDTSCIINAPHLKKDIDDWQAKIMRWVDEYDSCEPTNDDIEWAIETGKEFLLRVDKIIFKAAGVASDVR